MLSELKPCPFCGSENVSTNTVEPPPGFGELIPIRYGVFCSTCFGGNRYYNTEQEAIAAWNRRVSDAEER